MTDKQDQNGDNSEYTIDLAVKVGGSCLTDKSTKEQLRDGALERLSKLAAGICAAVDMTEAEEKDSDGGQRGHRQRRRRWVLINGAGSFGHPQAKAACLSSGCLGPDGAPLTDLCELNRRRLGFCETRRSVLHLVNQITDNLIAAGVPAVALSPANHYRCLANRLASHWPKELTNQTRALLTAGFTVQLHGDAVLECEDSNRGWAVLSGDALMAQLAGTFRLRRAVFVTEAGGVFSADPAVSTNARLLDEICLDSSTGQIFESRDSDGGDGSGGCIVAGGAAPGVVDVTGGMGGKLSAITGLLRNSPSTEVRICGLSDAEAACLTGVVRGTRVTMTGTP